MENQILPRDAYIEEVYHAALKDRNIIFMTADLGAKGLDRFRVYLKDQFLHVGISEQNMMNVAAGLSRTGKKVFTYAMSSFIAFRDFEQIKVNLASLNCPVTMLSIGVGLGYDHAGPTHYATEDIGCLRSLANIEIFSPSDTQSIVASAKLSCKNPALRYVRIDRQFLPDIYKKGNNEFLENGLVEVESGEDLCIISTGYMTHRAKEARKILADKGIKAGVVDAFRLKPFNSKELGRIIDKYKGVVTLEEHFLSAGLGSIITEEMADLGILKPIKRIGMKDHYYFENGGREFLHKKAGIDLESVVEKVNSFYIDKFE